MKKHVSKCFVFVAIALVVAFAALLFIQNAKDTVAVQAAKEAYAQYVQENPLSKEGDFIYIYEEHIIVAIRNGEVIRKEFVSEAHAVKAATGESKALHYSLSSTNNGKLYAVKLFDKQSDIYAVGSQTLAAGAESLTIKVVSNGSIFANFEIPASAIANTAYPVDVTIRKIDPKENVKLGANQEGFAYDIDVSNLVENNTSLIKVSMNGPKGLVSGTKDKAITVYHKETPIASTYDAKTGEVSFKTTDFSPYTFTYDMITVNTVEDLRKYLQREGSGNIRLGQDIAIDMATYRDTEAEDTAGKVVSRDVDGYNTFYARAFYNGEWVYFGSLIIGDKALDLNGCKITYTGSKTTKDVALFAVASNSALTIIDSTRTETNGEVKTVIKGKISVPYDQYGIWSVNYSSTANIYGGVFMTDAYVTADKTDPGAALLYSSGGKINVFGGYYMYSGNGAFNVINEVDDPTIRIYEGVSLSNNTYMDKQNDADSVVLMGGAGLADTATDDTAAGTEVTSWYKVTGRKLQVIEKLENENFLYRVGNASTFPLGAFFEALDGEFDISKISVRFVDIAATSQHNLENPFDKTDKDGNQNGNYYSYLADITTAVAEQHPAKTLSAYTVKFLDTFRGPVRLELCNSDFSIVYASINLEVVDGKNATSVMSATSSNVCLLNDIATSSTISISGGHSFYGNGFTITDSRQGPSGNLNGLVVINDGILDNIKIDGYSSTNASGSVNSAGGAPIVIIQGKANIYNSYIAGGRQAVRCAPKSKVRVHLKNVTLDGGAMANMEISGGDVILENCITTTDTRNGYKGMGIMVTTTAAHLTLRGNFTQHHWLQSSDLELTYSTILSDVYAGTVNEKEGIDYSPFPYNSYLNMGVFFFSESTDFYKDNVQASLLTDETGNTYGYIQKEYGGHTATCYLPKGAVDQAGAAATVGKPDAYKSLGNHIIEPNYLFDHTVNDAARTDGNNEYCFYNENSGYVEVSFETNGKKVWNPNILTVTKFGRTLKPSITMNGTDYTDKTITFTEAGEYTVIYTYTDPYNCTADNVTYSSTYTVKLNIKVTVVTPENVVYHPEFTYTDGSGTKKVVINNETYIMPDVSKTSNTIGSTTVGGQTVYYPIVTVGGSDKDGNAYENGKIFFFCPAFTAINIKDVNKDTGETLYTYDATSNTKKWPHDISDTTKVTQGTYFGYTADSQIPYPYDGDSKYHVCQYNATYGLSFVSKDMEKDQPEDSRLVKFYYVGNDNVTYYYYIKYYQPKVTHQSCVTPDTMITLADGRQVRVDSLTGNELLLAWNLKTGKYEAAPIVFVDTEIEKAYEIIHLYFSDGSDVKVISEHGFFDLDLGKYVYIDAENYADYVGHRFVSEGDISNNNWNVVTLDEVKLETEVTTAWSPVTFEHLCYYTNGVLSMPGGIDGLFNIFDVDTDTMTYDQVQMQKDIETYGLFTYEDFGGLIPEIAFDAFNGQYLKVAIGKGLLTWEQIQALAERYVPLM